MAQRRGKQQPREFSEEEQEYDEYANDDDDNHFTQGRNIDDLDDEKDRIIQKQKQMMEEMQNEFAATLDSLRAQLRDFIDESSKVQEDMLDRIKELKAELNQARKKTVRTGAGSAAVKSSLYNNGPKHPRKLAQADTRRSQTGWK
ncbi:hypothetical protein TRFO_42859 [Tritrichomonas foetus]|uniref:Uncharacterized protein n=1 Tax=Tritrichomonas foetus TaxID=1144522 RepID=A0A1J4KUQ0_9EUKA|nr:hypothetical protein TRFO_42867 [Tritrichomonas foetus]OHT14870.1 hypothetical protein TRFO_42859 [Tritrichomonas foetus]|eukprot:OHT14866.1 hypothetical protein TRFO_42867 [Tritrichomonas foetus]